MKTALKHFLSDIKRGENIDIYISLILALILAVLGVVGTIQLAILAAGILATLGILAYSMLATRRTLSELSQTITLLEPATKVLLKDRSTLRSFREDIERVSTIWSCGPTLMVMWGANRDIFREMVQKGGNMRGLIFNQASNRLPILAELLGVSPDKLKVEIATTIENWKELLESDIGTGKIEDRQTETMPGYSMVIYNPTEHSGQMVVEYLGYHTRLSERPHLELDATRDRRWFNYYLNKFDGL